MELGFVATAFRRYFWIIVLLAGLGSLPGLLHKEADSFTSRAVLLLSRPSGLNTSEQDPDRYIAGQLSILRSEALAQRVVNRVGGGATISSVLDSATFSREQDSDIVFVEIEAGTPGEAQALGNAFLDAYFEQLQAQIDDVQQPQLERLQSQIDSLRSQLAQVDTDLAAAIKPYLSEEPVPTGQAPPQIPSLEQAAPALVSTKVILLAELTRATEAKADYDDNVGTSLGGVVVQRASLPLVANPKDAKKLSALGIIGGGFAGAIIAVVLARISGRILGDDQAEEILGHRMVAQFPRSASLTREKRLALTRPPREIAAQLDSLCVLIETTGSDDQGLAVLVTGTRRGAGATSMSMALALRLARTDARVLVIDADRRHPRISDTFRPSIESREEDIVRPPMAAPGATTSDVPATIDSGITADNGAIIDAASSSDNGRRREGRRTLVVPPPKEGGTTSAIARQTLHLGDHVYPTSQPNINVLGIDGLNSVAGFRRQDTALFLAEAAKLADILVIDGGPLLDSVSTVHFASLCQTVVLSIPTNETSRALESVGSQLTDAAVLPVWTPRRRRRLLRGSSRKRAADPR